MSHFAEEYHLDIAAGRDPNKKASDSLAAAPCSRWALFLRHHDRYRDEWTEWKEIQGRELWEKFGATVDEWKQHAKGWIEMGGTYEIKIVQITERVEWSIHYENETSPSAGAVNKDRIRNTMNTNQPTPLQRVRLCRYCAQKLGLWEEWKSNYCLYDHATTMPCGECNGQNLRDPLASFTVRLSLPND